MTNIYDSSWGLYPILILLICGGWRNVFQWTNYLNPSNIKGLSVYTILLAMIGNGLLLPRALFTRDLMWYAFLSPRLIESSENTIMKIHMDVVALVWSNWSFCLKPAMLCEQVCWIIMGNTNARLGNSYQHVHVRALNSQLSALSMVTIISLCCGVLLQCG